MRFKIIQWDATYVMRYSALAIRKMQIIIIIRYHYTPIAMAKRKQQCQMLWRMQRNWINYTLLVGMWNRTAILERVWQFPNKTKHTITIWPNSCALGHLSKRNGNYVHTKSCAWMFIAHLFIIASNWKQSKYLPG